MATELAAALGAPMHYDDSSEIMDEIAALTPTFAGVSFAKLDEVGSVQWPCNDAKPLGTPIMHEGTFVRGLGNFNATPYVPTEERSTRRFPLLLTTGRILSQYNVGAQTRRTSNVLWHPEDILEIHPARRRGARHRRRRRGHAGEPRRRHHVARDGLRSHAAGRGVHDVPPPGQRRQRRDHRVERLGHQLSGVQGDRRAGHAGSLARRRSSSTIPSIVSVRWCAWPTRSPVSSHASPTRQR